MWLNSFFSKPKINGCEATIQNCINEDKVDEDKVNEDKVNNCKVTEEKVNEVKVTEEKVNEVKVTEEKVNEVKVNEVKVCEESAKILSKNEEELIIKTDLQERVEHVKVVHENIQAIQNKQDLNCSIDTTNAKKNEEINNCKIEAVLRIIPVIEKNLQTLTKKVSCLSGLINMKQVNAKIETDQNIVLNNPNINSPNSINKLNIMENTTTSKKKDITLGKVSKKNKKPPKNKLSVTKKKKKPEKPEKPETNLTKTIKENDQVTNPENLAENNTKSIDQLTNYLDGRLECFFTKIQSALSQYKIDKINEKCEIMAHLSGLDNKMNTNEMNIDKLMSNVQQLSKKNECEIMKKQSSIKTENKQDLQKSIDDIKMCIDYLIQPNASDEQQTQQCTDTPNTNKNINIKNKCTSDRCVCQLVNNANAANIQIINSKDGHNQLKYGDIILCEFLKARLTMEMFKRSEQQNKVRENQFSNKVDNKKISHLSVCSKKLSNISNNCVGNQIEDNTACNLSVCSTKSNHVSNNCVGNQTIDNKLSNTTACSKKSNQLQDNCVQKQNEEQKINQVMSQLCPKQSIHHFSKVSIENDIKLNLSTSKKSVCEKNQICEFLASQPIPEWIRRSQNITASDNPCKNPPTNCHLNSKLYNIERIVKDKRDKNNTDCTVYEITQEQNVPEENKKCRAFKEKPVVPCNSLNSKPSNWKQ